ncbi:hypothetical protein [Mycoplasma amphoriforme]
MAFQKLAKGRYNLKHFKKYNKFFNPPTDLEVATKAYYILVLKILA